MSRNERIIKSVESNFALEGMYFSTREKKTMMNCLQGKMSFESAIKSALNKYKKTGASR